MFYQYEIINDSLYLYLNNSFEFASDNYEEKTSTTIYKKVLDFIYNNNINFQGNKIYLVNNDLIMGSLTITNDLNVEPPTYKYTEILDNIIPKELEIIGIDKLDELKNNKLVSIKYSSGIIEKVKLEDYIVLSLANEVDLNWHDETIKAQAVLNRTYAKRASDANLNIEKSLAKDWDFFKLYWKENFSKNVKRLRYLTYETHGECLTYDGKYIDVYYHYINNGKTSSSANILKKNIPYLKQIKSPWDNNYQPYTNITTITYEELGKKLGYIITHKTKIKVKNDKELQEKIVYINDKKYRSFSFYSALKLNSPNFEITKNNNSVSFICHESGISLGMSQCGADGMAKGKYNYKDILEHYFPGTKILKN